MSGFRMQWADYSSYNVRTGKAIVPPVGIRIPTYPVSVEDGRIMVTIDWPE